MIKLKSTVKSVLRKAFAAIKKDSSKIMFESFPDISDNSQALYEYMLSQKLNEAYKIVWCVDDPSKHKPAPKNVVFTSFRKKSCIFSYLYHIATAKTVFFTHARPPLYDTSTQTVICLWHGIPLKMITLDPNASEDPYENFSWLISSGEWYDSVMQECFGAKKEQFAICGFPRNDLLFQKNDALIKLGINQDGFRNIIVWMPTFRQNALANYSDSAPTENGLPLLSTRTALIECNEKLRKLNQLLILKLHPAQDLRCIEANSLSHIKILTNDDLASRHIKLYHLLANADCLLTDYSSVYLDYLLLDRPIGFIIDDIGIYGENRGFTVDDPFQYMPGQEIEDIPSLYRFFANVAAGKDDYAAKRAWVCDQMHYYRDGDSCRRITEKFII